ncbi:diacylglycerol kinase family protein [Acetobacteraceae bacterium ESL0709]|nr:diacylglycerol kinase family protein [Acetobacteraceae bacterium ESL0697]MDF7677628.1 diacylglycerol kinase family protein [Acetobacteraceae bacterium ESL0709]
MSLSPKRALFVFNPVAGHYRLGRVRGFVEALRRCGWDVTVRPSQYRGHGALIVREALAQRASDLVIIGGGDGTISECAWELLDSTVPLAIFPIGSANVLARELKIPFNDRHNARMIERVFNDDGAKTIWPGMISTPEGQTLFIQMLGMGPDGWIVHHVSTALKKHIGRAAYVVSALKCLLSYKFTPFTLNLDGETTEVTAAILTKGRYYGGKFQLISSSSQEKRSFTALLFRGTDWYDFLKACLSLLLFQKKSRFMDVKSITTASLPPNQNVDLQSDGDILASMEAHITISSRALKVIAP